VRPIEKAGRGRQDVYGRIHGRYDVLAVLVDKAHADPFLPDFRGAEFQADNGEKQGMRGGHLGGVYRIEANADGRHFTAALVGVITKESEINFHGAPY